MYLCIRVPYREEGEGGGGGGALGTPPHTHKFIGMNSTPLGGARMCICASGFHTERRGRALGTPPHTHKLIGMNSTPLDVWVPECIFVHQGFIWRGGGDVLGLFTKGQTTARPTSLPLAPLLKLPEDRLHQDRQAFPWHLSRSYQRTDYIE